MLIEKTLATFRTPGDSATSPGEYTCLKIKGGAQPYVTHWHNTQNGGYFWGHYFDTEAEAMADFLERCQSWLKRYSSMYDRERSGTTTYVDRQGVKHYGLQARSIAEREGGKITIE